MAHIGKGVREEEARGLLLFKRRDGKDIHRSGAGENLGDESDGVFHRGKKGKVGGIWPDGKIQRLGEAHNDEIVGEGFEGKPTLQLDRLVEDGETVVAIGSGEAQLEGGGVHRFVYCDVFTFRGDLIARVESYLVALTDADG